MDRADFELVTALARTGSLTAASRALHVAQPALSRRLRALEREVGARLFHRGRHGAVATVVGRVLVERAGHALAAIERAATDVADAAAGHLGRLRIGVAHTLGVELLPSGLGAFREAHPEVRIEMQASGDSSWLRSAVRDGELDVAICAVGVGRRAEPGIRVAASGTQRFVLVAPADLDLGAGRRRRGKVPTSALVGLPMVTLRRGEGLRGVLDAVLAEQGAVPEIAIETAEREMLLPFVAAGLGACLLPEGFARQRLVAGLVLHDLHPTVDRAVGVVVPAGELPLTLTDFVAALAEPLAMMA